MTYTIEKVTTLIGAHRFGTADANIGFLLTTRKSTSAFCGIFTFAPAITLEKSWFA